MKFMIIVKATEATEAGVMPSEKLFIDMGNFNEELVKAGVMLAGEGLQPSSKGARIRFDGDKRTVIELEVDEIGPSIKYATAHINRAASGSAEAIEDDPWASAPAAVGE